MSAQLIIMDITGNALRWLWSAACAAILFFLAAAVFYHGAWRHVVYAALAASLLYRLSSAYDGLFASFAAKYGNRPSPPQEKAAPILFSNPQRRRSFAIKLPVNGRAVMKEPASLAETR